MESIIIIKPRENKKRKKEKRKEKKKEEKKKGRVLEASKETYCRIQPIHLIPRQAS